MAFQIFVVNPGSTSTKIAVFEGDCCVFEKKIKHPAEELTAYPEVIDQFEYRLGLVTDIEWDFSRVDAFAGRGGILRPLKSGTYLVDQDMLDDLRTARYGNHASNLGALISSTLADRYGKKAYIVDPPVVDEMMEIARVTGLPQIRRVSVFHALNQRSAAMRAALEAGIPYEKGRFIVAHLGGGISVGVHDFGRVTDVNNGIEEGPFSPERAGTLPAGQLVDLCFSGGYTKAEIKKMLAGKGGLYAHTGTTDCERIEEEAERDGKVRTILDAMVYKIAREICANAAALCGRIDGVIVTGGLARSNYIVNGIKERVGFLGRFFLYPGEDEMSALARGVAGVLEGSREAYEYGKGGCE